MSEKVSERNEEEFNLVVGNKRQVLCVYTTTTSSTIGQSIKEVNSMQVSAYNNSIGGGH